MIVEALRRWWNRPMGRLPWHVVLALVGVEALALWGAFAWTDSEWVQLGVLLAGSEVWATMSARAARTRPFPRPSDLPYTTISGLVQFIGLMILLGGAAVGMTFVTDELGQWFWIYVCLLAPLSILGNTETFRRRYSRGFRGAERFTSH